MSSQATTPPAGSRVWKGGVPISVQKGTAGKPTVLILGWLGSIDKHLAKYADVYAAQGCTVVRCSCSAKHVMSGDDRSVILSAREALEAAEAALKEAGEGSKFFLHIFSNNGCWLYAEMLQMIKGPQEACPRPLRQIEGLIFDSSPAFMWLSSGLGAASMAVPAGPARKSLQALRFLALTTHRLRHVLAAVFLGFAVTGRWRRALALLLYGVLGKSPEYFGRPARFWRNMLTDPLWDIPRLYIYSADDHLTSADKLEELIAHRRAKGQKSCSVVHFQSSPHCGHLRSHPETYTESVLKFLGVRQ